MGPATVWTSATWLGEEFLSELRAFVHAGVGPVDRIELVQHRPWSAVWRVSAPGLSAYAKQNCPGQAHEARLVGKLSRIAPEAIVPVLAADPRRDLLLTADLGSTVRETADVADIDLWCRVVAEAAELQRTCIEHADALGLTVLAPGDATSYVADATGRLGGLSHGDPRRLPEGDALRLQELLPVIERWSDRVEDTGLSLTLQHNDLHASNVVASAGRLRFFDFGDAVVAEPLGALLMPLIAVQRELECAPGDPRLWRIADAVLEVWGDQAALPALRAALPAALQLALIARVESWRRCVASMTGEEQATWGGVPAAWLAKLLQASPLG